MFQSQHLLFKDVANAFLPHLESYALQILFFSVHHIFISSWLLFSVSKSGFGTENPLALSGISF